MWKSQLFALQLRPGRVLFTSPIFAGITILPLHQFQTLELYPVGANMCKVVLRLLHKSAFGAAGEHLG